jgi:hypothetical protein
MHVGAAADIALARAGRRIELQRAAVITEWAVDVFKPLARGLNAYISNGNGTPQVLDFIRSHGCQG